MYHRKGAMIVAIAAILLLFSVWGNAEEIDIWYGNTDGDPIEAQIGQRFDVDVYISTEDDVYVGSMLICLGANEAYVESLLSATEGTLYSPLDEWDAVYFNTVRSYEDGWSCESFQGYRELSPPYDSPALNLEVPTRVMTMKMKAVNNSDYNNNLYEAFEAGLDPFQGPSNASDTNGTRNFVIEQHFCMLQFGELPPNDPPNEPSDPSPENGAIDQAVDVDLSWTCTDPDDGNTITYDLYFGAASEPEIYAEDITTESYDLPELTGNTTYYWKIVATDNYYESTEGPVWSFTTGEAPNNPPNEPSDPSPANNATAVSLDTQLEWTCSDPDDDELNYNVYFGTDQSDLALVSENQTGNSYSFANELEYETNYYWYIVAYDSEGDSTVGETWNFTTLLEDNNPPNVPTIDTSHDAPDSAAISIPIDAILSWVCTDPDGDDLSYNVYFGDSEEPDLVSEMQTGTSYEPEGMEYLTTYYWKVVAYDPDSDSTVSGLWYFTTGASHEVYIWYGNIDEDLPIDTEIGLRFDVDVYMYTEADIYVGDINIALGADQTYVDSLLNQNEAEYYYPFDQWDAVYFNDIYEYEEGWFCESFLGYYELTSPYDSPALHLEVPTLVMTMKMKSVSNNDYAQQTYAAFEAGQDLRQGYSRATDTTGIYDFTVGQSFCELHFGDVYANEQAIIPTDYSLAQNYPNPFNAVTTIEFNLPQASSANIYIYNIQGRLVKHINKGVLTAGQHSITWNASSVSSGMYFYKLVTDQFSDTKKMMLLK